MWVVKSAEYGLGLRKAKLLIQSNKITQSEKTKAALKYGIAWDSIHILHFNHLIPLGIL
jgi:hypothetical protein